MTDGKEIFSYEETGENVEWEAEFFYDEDTITDQPEKQIVAELIREKALRLLNDEIPHGIAVTIEVMKERFCGKEGFDRFVELLDKNSIDYTGNGCFADR